MLRWILTAFLAVTLAGAAAAQDSNYRIKEGDTLSIEVLEDTTLNRSILVLPDGNISFPMAGTLKAAGLTVAQLRNAITVGLRPNFASAPSVFVAVQSISPRAPVATSRKIDVYLMGEVQNPGLHQVDRGTTLLQLLAQSGGFTKFAAKKRIQLRRVDPATGQPKTYRIDYRSIEMGGDAATATAQLVQGDVIVVPERRLFE